MSSLRRIEAPDERPASAAATARELGRALLRAGTGEPEVVVSGLQSEFLAAFSGICSRLRASEPFRRSVCQKHFDGISRSRLARRERISSATVERWFGDYLRRAAAERASPVCPQVLGIDEHLPSAVTATPPPSAICATAPSTTSCWAAAKPRWTAICTLAPRQASGESRVHGSGRRLPGDRAQTLPQCADRGRSFPRYPTRWRGCDLVPQPRSHPFFGRLGSDFRK